MKTTKFYNFILFVIFLIQFSYAISKSQKTHIEKSNINQEIDNTTDNKNSKSEVFLGIPAPEDSPTFIPSSRYFKEIEEEIEKEFSKVRNQPGSTKEISKQTMNENKNIIPSSSLNVKYIAKEQNNSLGDKFTPRRRLDKPNLPPSIQNKMAEENFGKKESKDEKKESIPNNESYQQSSVENRNTTPQSSISVKYAANSKFTPRRRLSRTLSSRFICEVNIYTIVLLSVLFLIF